MLSRILLPPVPPPGALRWLAIHIFDGLLLQGLLQNHIEKSMGSCHFISRKQGHVRWSRHALVVDSLTHLPPFGWDSRALCPLCHLRIRLLGPPVSRDPLHRFGLRAVRRVTSTFLSLAGPRLWEPAAQTEIGCRPPAFEVLQAANGHATAQIDVMRGKNIFPEPHRHSCGPKPPVTNLLATLSCCNGWNWNVRSFRLCWLSRNTLHGDRRACPFTEKPLGTWDSTQRPLGERSEAWHLPGCETFGASRSASWRLDRSRKPQNLRFDAASGLYVGRCWKWSTLLEPETEWNGWNGWAKATACQSGCNLLHHFQNQARCCSFLSYCAVKEI